MSFNRREASRTMHLVHVPDEKEREDSLSHCHICLRKCKLTREHIPPKKASMNTIDCGSALSIRERDYRNE
ncbi:hypothetical protein BROC_01119 [Candidatus Brocadiaceae bacterium]|nr:hypothetical protein BROC_01119 [Candidatus Brocadiaceae bacterium]